MYGKRPLGKPMNPIQLFDTNLSSFTYLLFDESSRDALIIDPVDSQMERDLAPLRRYGLRLVWTEETHAHADHITSAGLMAEHTGAAPNQPSALRKPTTRGSLVIHLNNLSPTWNP